MLAQDLTLSRRAMRLKVTSGYFRIPIIDSPENVR